LKSKLALINKLTPQGRLLDYGCGTGAFINTCKKNGWTVSGVELDDDARNIAQTHTHTTIVPSYEQLDNNIKFDIISLWHVLEHVSNLNETIVELKHKMVKKGRLIVAVPNHDSLDQQIYKQHWAAYDLPRHLYHFNQKTIKAIMKRHQLKLIETHPMKMDAYYVSLLSEQHLKADHKSKGNMFVNAIINGYKSNTYAKNNQNNYSSLIYVFEK
jgi:2-polyprenyl-3-methyl-5-hydroxy-6-metoxy-1,4-benzoquinol methylase